MRSRLAGVVATILGTATLTLVLAPLDHLGPLNAGLMFLLLTLMIAAAWGWHVGLFAAITTLAPSRAARKAIASPMPREAPVMNRVLPLSVLMERGLRAGG